jgi:hypothetical protein
VVSIDCVAGLVWLVVFILVSSGYKAILTDFKLTRTKYYSILLAVMQGKLFKEATWWPQYLEAKVLELFVNLEESAEAFKEAHPDFENEKRHPLTPAEFRKAYPDFAPGESWWDYYFGIDTRPLTESKKQWRVLQTNLRELWDRGGFPLDMSSLLMMLLMIFDTDSYIDPRPPFGSIFDIDLESPYYQSLVWLNGQPWRARVCKLCKRRFIASWPSNEHCSQHCTAVALREYKREFRAARAAKYNRNRRLARAKSKLQRIKRLGK